MKEIWSSFKIQPLQWTKRCLVTVMMPGLFCSEWLQHLSWSSLPGLAVGRSNSRLSSLLSWRLFWGLLRRISSRASISPTFSFFYLLLENMAKYIQKYCPTTYRNPKSMEWWSSEGNGPKCTKSLLLAHPIGSKSHYSHALQSEKDIWPLSPNEIIQGVSLQESMVHLYQVMNSPTSIFQSFRVLGCAASIATSSAQDGAAALQRHFMLDKLEMSVTSWLSHFQPYNCGKLEEHKYCHNNHEDVQLLVNS